MGLLAITLAAFRPLGAQTEESEADPSALLPTDDDRKAVEVMLAKLSPDEEQLVASLLLQIEDLRKELATLKMFHRVVVKECDSLRAELARFVAVEQPAPAQITVIRGKITSVDSIAPLIMVEFKAERNIPIGSELAVISNGDRIGGAAVVLSEGNTVIAELVIPANAAPPKVDVGDQVEYVVEGE
jgi:hypothetical protein